MREDIFVKGMFDITYYFKEINNDGAYKYGLIAALALIGLLEKYKFWHKDTLVVVNQIVFMYVCVCVCECERERVDLMMLLEETISWSWIIYV